MTTLREAAQQALEALEQSETTVPYEGFGMARRVAEWRHQAAITALRAALAEPVQEHEDWCASVTQLLLCDPPRKAPCNCKKKVAEPVQEPVAWRCRDCGGTDTLCPHGHKHEPLYTAPPQRKPLTQEKIWHIYKNLWMFHPAEEPRLAGDVLKFARAVERAHEIGGEE